MNKCTLRGKGIADAEISLALVISRAGYSNREATKINAEGRYEIRAVPSGYKYFVAASAKGYGQQYVNLDTAEADDGRMDLEPLVLMVANLSVSGIVVDADGKPVANADVRASGRRQPGHFSFRGVRTDTQGRFRIEGVCAARLQVRADGGRRKGLYGSVETEGGATDVKIVVSQRGTNRRYVPKQPPSLLGKPLPDLTGIEIDFSPAQHKGKMILVCFWDMNQRPSRYCIRELAKRAEELSEKEVTILAVQTSKIDENKLDRWVTEYNIPFTVGMIEGDDEKTRFAWGVRSLPWLILTDRKHVIQTEGFGLEGLDEKITQSTIRRKQ